MSDIVIIDDEPVTRKILAALVAAVSKPHRIVEFGCAQEAFDWALRHSVALVITDYKMPNMNGLDFIRKFRAQPGYSETPIIMVSADGDGNIQTMARHAGATEFLLKPVDHRIYRARCQALLG